MKSSLFTVVAAVWLTSLTPVFAAQEQYKCEINGAKGANKHGRIKFTDGPVFLWIESDGSRAHAADPLIQTVHKAPIEVNVQKNTDRVFRAHWVISNGRDSKGRTISKFRYSLILNKASGRMDFYAKPIGFSNSFSSVGVCKPTRLKALPQS